MSASSFTLEDDVEQQAIDWLVAQGYQDLRATSNGRRNEQIYLERGSDEHNILLTGRLRLAFERLNPGYTDDDYSEAVRQMQRLADSPDMMIDNHKMHKFLIEGVKISRSVNGENRTLTLRPIDFKNVESNDFVVTNQVTVLQGDHNRRPDIVLYINGLPLVTFELKNLSNVDAGISNAYNQFQTYKREISNFMRYNEILVTADMVQARAGSLTANESRFMQWRLPEEVNGSSKPLFQLESLIRGMMNPITLLDLIQNFIIFETDGDKTIKILAAYHQYYMVNKAVTSAKRAVETPGDNQIGVVWHTQGSGKSLSMVFFSGIVGRELGNPTIVVINDRNDLDNQLSGTFAAASEFLGQEPQQADSREDMRRLLSVNSGGIVFTTMQKFSPEFENGETDMPVLTARDNVIVMADEAHRTQYGLGAKYSKDGETKYGYAKYLRDALPNASYIGFTGTPIDMSDKSTKAVFGDYIDVYDMTRAVEDHATVKIYFEGHVIPLDLDKAELTEEVIEFLDNDLDENPDTAKYARLEALAGSAPRVKKLAEHFVEHFETRQKAEDGKSMIVAMSRRNAVAIYDAIVKLRPEWHSDDLDKGKIKIIFTANASDDEYLTKHHTNKKEREHLQRRMKNDADELKIVIVVDMWLTGFDAPSTNTMYIDKPMKGHNLMQAIARVNRVFKDKDSGLVVDYIGIADNLKSALQQYSPSDQEQAGINIEKAISVMQEKYNIITRDYLYGVDYSNFNSRDRSLKLETFRNVLNDLLSPEEFSVNATPYNNAEPIDPDKLTERQTAFRDTVTQLQRAFALVATTSEAQTISEELAFFVALKNAMIKMIVTSEGGGEKSIDYRMRQLLDKSIIPGEVVDLYKDLGLARPELDLLSDEFLDEVQNMPQKNLALDLLERLLKGQVKALTRTNLVKAKKFDEMLAASIESYNARGLTTEIVIRQLIDMAKDINTAQKEGEKLGLSPEEVAFYDALADHNKAREEMGEEKLHQLAAKLVEEVRKNTGTDWVRRDSARAQMRVAVKKLLRQFGYPPDFAAAAIDTVVTQAEKMALNES